MDFPASAGRVTFLAGHPRITKVASEERENRQVSQDSETSSKDKQG